MLAYLRELHQGPGRDPASMLYSEPNALLMPLTNWTRAEFFKTLDFSNALVRVGDSEQSRLNSPGTMVFHHAQAVRQNSAARNVIVILGKDHGDNY